MINSCGISNMKRFFKTNVINEQILLMRKVMELIHFPVKNEVYTSKQRWD